MYYVQINHNAKNDDLQSEGVRGNSSRTNYASVTYGGGTRARQIAPPAPNHSLKGIMAVRQSVHTIAHYVPLIVKGT